MLSQLESELQAAPTAVDGIFVHQSAAMARDAMERMMSESPNWLRFA